MLLSDSDDHLDSDDEDSEIFSFETEKGDLSNLKPQMAVIVNKVRTIVKLFRRSPVKNDLLQKYVRSEFGKELRLMEDCKTRWNSLISMLKRFYDLKGPILKALIDLKGHGRYNISDEELETISEVIQALEPVQAAVEHICREHCTLYEADVALQFMLEQLLTQNSDIALKLFDALKERIQQRRSEYADLFAFLSNPAAKGSLRNDFGIFFKTSKSNLIKQADEILKRLTAVGGIDSTDEIMAADENEVDNVQEACSSLTVKEKLERRLQECKATLPLVNSISTAGSTKSIKTEFSFYESEKLKGKYLTMVFDALTTIRPTSVESERAFSVSGNIANKIRSSLGDESLSMLCLLKFYFAKQQ